MRRRQTGPSRMPEGWADMSKARILIADDDRLVLATLSASLKEAGYETLEANDGAEAVELCERHHPDLAILDIRMPGMDGIEAAAKLQERTGTPFIILSAYPDEELVAKATDLGALGYLVKPVHAHGLIPALEAALKRAREIRDLKESRHRLISVLEGDQVTSTAVGVIMERHRLSKKAAFEKLRGHARSQRRKLTEIANELVDAVELANNIRDNLSD